VVGIFNTWTDLNSCHMHLRITAEAVERGVSAKPAVCPWKCPS